MSLIVAKELFHEVLANGFFPIRFALQDSYMNSSYESNDLYRNFSHKNRIQHNSYDNHMNQRSTIPIGFK